MPQQPRPPIVGPPMAVASELRLRLMTQCSRLITADDDEKCDRTLRLPRSEQVLIHRSARQRCTTHNYTCVCAVYLRGLTDNKVRQRTSLFGHHPSRRFLRPRCALTCLSDAQAKRRHDNNDVTRLVGACRTLCMPNTMLST
jgi:hypothetical protein